MLVLLGRPCGGSQSWAHCSEEEVESLMVFPVHLIMGNVCVEMMDSLLVSSLSFEAVGFLGKGKERGQLESS